MGWTDTVPKIRAMLDDPDLRVREAAAEALRELTGERLQVARPEAAFPALDECEGLLVDPLRLPTRGRHDADFVAVMPWLDGAPRVVCGFEASIPALGRRGELLLLTAALEQHAAWPMPYDLEALLHVPTVEGGVQLVGLVDDEHEEQTWQTVIAWSEDGLELWRKRTPQQFMADIAPLHGELGPAGVVIAAGGETGLLAVDLAGKPLWDVPRQFVLYGLSTHARLPGYVLAAGGAATIFRHEGREVHIYRAPSRRRKVFVHHGVLFPDDDGAPATILAGTVHAGNVPTLRRIDHEGRVVWEAQLPFEIEGLALLEPINGPRLVAVTTERGELLLVDDAGTLRWRGDMPEADPGDRVATYQLVAGEIGRGRYGLVVRLLGDSYLYRLDLDALVAHAKR